MPTHELEVYLRKLCYWLNGSRIYVYFRKINRCFPGGLDNQIVEVQRSCNEKSIVGGKVLFCNFSPTVIHVVETIKILCYEVGAFKHDFSLIRQGKSILTHVLRVLWL